jgi:hypothetical protein
MQVQSHGGQPLAAVTKILKLRWLTVGAAQRLAGCDCLCPGHVAPYTACRPMAGRVNSPFYCLRRTTASGRLPPTCAGLKWQIVAP